VDLFELNQSINIIYVLKHHVNVVGCCFEGAIIRFAVHVVTTVNLVQNSLVSAFICIGYIMASLKLNQCYAVLNLILLYW